MSKLTHLAFLTTTMLGLATISFAQSAAPTPANISAAPTATQETAATVMQSRVSPLNVDHGQAQPSQPVSTTAKPGEDAAKEKNNDKEGDGINDSAFESDSFNLPAGLPDSQQPGAQPEVKDPYQDYNRSIYKINNKLDEVIAKPVATFYQKIMPKPLYNMVNNFFNNISNIPTVINDVLQGNLYQADSDSWRFVINSTIGIGGFFDVAQHTGLEYNYEDFGLTLAQWGWTDSSYFVLPIYGPNTIRGTIGKPITYYMSIFPYIKNWRIQWGLYALYLINERAQLLQYQNVMDNAALDPYIFTRDAYLQRQAYLIQRNHELDNPNTIAETKAYHDPYYLYQ